MKREKVVIYGAGYMGKKLLPFIQKKYEVLCFVDKNAELWNSKIENITVSPLSYIKDRSEKILITTVWNSYGEIIDQLKNEKVDASRLFYAQYSEREKKLYIVPSQDWEPKEINCDLEEYDLLKRGERDNTHEILILCSFYTVYADALIKNVKERYPKIHFSILTQSTKYFSTLNDEVHHIYCFGTFDELYSILQLLPQYDVIQTLWIEDIWTRYYKLIRSKCRKLNLHVGGSDLYRSSRNTLKKKEEIIEAADTITAETETTIADFLEKFPCAKDKMRLQFFGLNTIEYQISTVEQKEIRKRLGLTNNRVMITCGHNGTRQHRHHEIIQTINHLGEEVISQCFFVFPMTYGDNDGAYTDIIRKEVEEAEFQGKVLTDFMNAYDMACYAKVSDIMIHVITTDQLSSTMLEELYAGSVVITGRWLPYKMLEEKGLFFLSIYDVKELKDVLENVVLNLAEFKEKSLKNRMIIRELFSWDNVAAKWTHLWGKYI